MEDFIVVVLFIAFAFFSVSLFSLIYFVIQINKITKSMRDLILILSVSETKLIEYKTGKERDWTPQREGQRRRRERERATKESATKNP